MNLNEKDGTVGLSPGVPIQTHLAKKEMVEGNELENLKPENLEPGPIKKNSPLRKHTKNFRRRLYLVLIFSFLFIDYFWGYIKQTHFCNQKILMKPELTAFKANFDSDLNEKLQLRSSIRPSSSEAGSEVTPKIHAAPLRITCSRIFGPEANLSSGLSIFQSRS